MIGKTIGKYRIVGQLGRGGMGTVYKAVDDTLDREVAIKVLNPELAETQIIKRFRTEAMTLARLSHPEIATIYELFRSETDLLMVMEFVRGETLDRISQRIVALPPEHAAYLIDKVLSALEHAHRAGIVHCDMKPANVMVTMHAGVKIMDFGIARVRGAEHATSDGHMMGTPAYMPPEQVLGKEVDARSDLYSVGIIFYRLLTGTLPFKADSAIAMVQQQISGEPMPLHMHRQGLPDWCEPILRRALAKSPADRFQTAEEFRQTLERATGTLKPEAAKAYFSSIADVEPPPLSQPGILDRIGLTRVWGGHPSATSASGKTANDATIVLPNRRFAFGGLLLVTFAACVTALAIGGPWRPAVAPAPKAADVPLPATESTTLSTSQTFNVPVATPATSSGPAATSATSSVPVSAPVTSFAPASTPVTSFAAASAPVTSSAPASTTGTPVEVAAVSPAETTVVHPADKPPAVPYVFDAIALMDEGDRPRERESQVFLVDGKINVKANDDNSVLFTLPFDGVLSITYSRGRDPLWNGPAGPTPVTRAGGGLGIFRGTRHWVSLRIRNANTQFVILRLSNDARAKSAIAALEERTGRNATIVADSQGDK